MSRLKKVDWYRRSESFEKEKWANQCRSSWSVRVRSNEQRRDSPCLPVVLLQNLLPCITFRPAVFPLSLISVIPLTLSLSLLYQIYSTQSPINNWLTNNQPTWRLDLWRASHFLNIHLFSKLCSAPENPLFPSGKLLTGRNFNSFSSGSLFHVTEVLCVTPPPTKNWNGSKSPSSYYYILPIIQFVIKIFEHLIFSVNRPLQ